MVFQKIYGSKKPAPNNQEEEEGSFLGDAVKSIARLPAVALKGLGDVSSTFTNELANASPGFKEVAHNFQPLVTTEKINKNEFLKPKNTFDEIADSFVGDIPLLWATGGLNGGIEAAAKTLGWQAASAGAVKGTKELGGGPLAQFVAGLSPFALRQLINKGAFPKQLRKWGEAHEKKSYAQAKIAGEFKTDFSEYKREIDKIIKKVDGLTDSADKSAILKRLGSVYNDVDKNGYAAINKIVGHKQEFNSLAYERNFNKTKTDVYKDVARVGKEALAKISKRHPTFGKPFNVAEDLHIGLKAKSAVTKILEKNTEVENILNSSKPLRSLTNLALLGIQFPAKRAGWLYDLLRNSKTLRNRYVELGKQAVNENRAEFANTLRKVKLDLDEEIKKDKNIKGNVRQLGDIKHLRKKG